MNEKLQPPNGEGEAKPDDNNQLGFALPVIPQGVELVDFNLDGISALGFAMPPQKIAELYPDNAHEVIEVSTDGGVEVVGNTGSKLIVTEQQIFVMTKPPQP